MVGWLKTHRTLLANAGSLVGTTALTSGLGFVYWWLAARHFSTETVGLASAAIAAMSLLATIGMLGLGTLLIAEIPRRPDKTGALIITALLVAGLAGLVLGGGFALVAPFVSAEFKPLSADLTALTLFATGVGISAMALVLDQALLGLLRGDLQLWRNGFFAVAKLAVLWLATFVVADSTGLSIYATWLVGNVISFLILAGFVVRRYGRQIFAKPELSLLRGLGKAAVGHHMLNLALLVPSLALPVLVTVLLSASSNAYFYVAWMIANLVFAIPASLTTVLYAVGANDGSALAQKTRLTLKLSLLVSLAANLGLLVVGSPILSFFGKNYAQQGTWTLYILGLGAFAITVKDHFVALHRIYGRVGQAVIPVVAGSIFELLLAGAGAVMGDLPGLAIGWLVAMAVEAVLLSPSVYRVAFPVQAVEPEQATA